MLQVEKVRELFIIQFTFLESIIDSLVYKALTHEDGNLKEEEGNMDPSDGENRNDLEESSKQEVNSPSMIIHLSLLRSIIIGILHNS